MLFGPESTGKTTLAEQLAEHYDTVWVPEFSRFYQVQKGSDCDLSDVTPIVQGQLQWEQEARAQANGLLICDTDLLETKVYSEAYNGTCPAWLLENVQAHTGDLYLLTSIDLPWIPDGIRNRPHEREAFYQRFEQELLQRQLSFVPISGNHQERFQKAVQAIDQYLVFRQRADQ